MHLTHPRMVTVSYVMPGFSRAISDSYVVCKKKVLIEMRLGGGDGRGWATTVTMHSYRCGVGHAHK